MSPRYSEIGLQRQLLKTNFQTQIYNKINSLCHISFVICNSIFWNTFPVHYQTKKLKADFTERQSASNFSNISTQQLSSFQLLG